LIARMARLVALAVALGLALLGTPAGTAAARTAPRKATMTLLDRSAPLDQRIAAARSLGRSGDRQAVPTLLSVLETREELGALGAAAPALRVEVTLALGLLQAPEAADTLLATLQTDRDATVRFHAANALGHIHTDKVTAALEPQLQVERDDDVKSMLEAALRRLDAARKR
jgi:HEAT repeat protein